MPFELLNSQILLQGRAFAIRRDEVRLPDGRTAQFDIVEHHGSVVLLPLDAQNRVLFVRQYRHAAGGDLLELPAGTLNPDEDPADCAARELREETGMAAGSLREVGRFFLSPGYSTEFMLVYLARDLRVDPLQADADEFLQVEAIPLREALDLAARGGVPDSKSLAALFLARKQLEPFLD